MEQHRPHPANVPGDFYIEDNCCTLCEIPFVEAPELFGLWPDSTNPETCYVKRQPTSDTEVERMVSAIQCAELQCIRYRGQAREVQLRLVEAGEGIICDGLPADLQRQTDLLEARRHAAWIAAEQKQAPKPWWRRLLPWK